VEWVDVGNFCRLVFESDDATLENLRHLALEDGHYGMFLRVIEEQLLRRRPPEESLDIQRAFVNGDFLEKYGILLAEYGLMPSDEELLIGLEKSGEIRGWTIDVPYTSTGQFYRQWCNRTFGDLILPETVVLVIYNLSNFLQDLPTLLMEVIEGRVDQNIYRRVIEIFGLYRDHHNIRGRIERKIDNDNIISALRNMGIPSDGHSKLFLPNPQDPSIQLGVAQITAPYNGRLICFNYPVINPLYGIQTSVSEPVPYQFIKEEKDLRDYVNRIFVNSLYEFNSTIKQIK
jgi:hypothetical protein